MFCGSEFPNNADTPAVAAEEARLHHLARLLIASTKHSEPLSTEGDIACGSFA
jgi:hypothetical protein